jgi:hypothetical protein
MVPFPCVVTIVASEAVGKSKLAKVGFGFKTIGTEFSSCISKL